MADDPETDTDDLVEGDPVDDVEDDTVEASPIEDGTDETDESAAASNDDPSADTTSKGAAKAAPVVRKKVVSKRVTPKGGARPAATTSASPRSAKAKAEAITADDDESFESPRYTPPVSRADAQLPSPWWVPALMFGFLVIGALVIMLNYMGAFGDAENYRLIIGLGLILAGIITATQYR